MRTQNHVMGIVGALFLTVVLGSSANADIIKDNLGGLTEGGSYNRIPGQYEPLSKTSLGVTITGNGRKVSQISFVMSLDYGDGTPNHPAEEGDFTIRAGFHPTVTGYTNDPFCWNPEEPNYFQQFDTGDIANPGWQDVIGTVQYLGEPGETHNLYLITLDMAPYNWVTTQGAEHLISLSIDDQEISPGVKPYFAPTTMHQGGEDWWASTIGFMGPPELLSQHPVFTWGANAAVRVETVSVPEPHSICAVALLAACLDGRRRRCKCKPSIATTATKVPPP